MKYAECGFVKVFLSYHCVVGVMTTIYCVVENFLSCQTNGFRFEGVEGLCLVVWRLEEMVNPVETELLGRHFWYWRRYCP